MRVPITTGDAVNAQHLQLMTDRTMKALHRIVPLVCVMVAAELLGCSGGPSQPSIVTNSPATVPTKTTARFVQPPWDLSLLFNLPGGAVLAEGRTNAAGDNLTGTFTNSTGFEGTLRGVLTGNLDSGDFDGTLKTVTSTGCAAERRYTGPLTTTSLNWTPRDQVNDCAGASPLSNAPIQAVVSTSPPCTLGATISTDNFNAGGGSGTLSITAGAGCSWFAKTTDSWLTVATGTGSGDGTVEFRAAANTSTSSRTATIVAATKTFTITQAGTTATPVCTYALNGSSTTFPAAGGSNGVDMRTAAGCAWTAASDASWLTITAGTTGNGNGTISYSASPNPDLGQRTGVITAAGQKLTVTQSGIGCSYTVTPPVTTSFTTAGGTGSAGVAAAAGCNWTATASVPWITVTSGATGSGNGTASFTVAASTDTAARTGTLTVAGQVITITQAATACTYALTSTTTSFPGTGGAGTTAVTTTTGCAWTGQSTVPWITFATPAAGTGSGTIAFTVASNTTAAAREGRIQLPGAELVISQQAGTFLHIEIVGSGPGFVARGNDAALCGGPPGTVCDVATVAGSTETLNLRTPGLINEWEAPLSCVGAGLCTFTPQVGSNLVRARFEGESTLTLDIATVAGYSPAPSVTITKDGSPLSVCNVDPSPSAEVKQRCQVRFYAGRQTTVVFAATSYNPRVISCWTGCVPDANNRCPLPVAPGTSPSVLLQLGYPASELPSYCQDTVGVAGGGGGQK
jgi:hypothetical protein